MHLTTYQPPASAEVLRQHAADAFESTLGDDLPQLLTLVGDICDSPMTALTLLGVRQVRVREAQGMSAPALWPGSDRLHAIVTALDRATAISDTGGEPAATDPTEIRFAAAAPLHRGQWVVGALCVFDTRPRRGDLEPLLRKLAGIARRVDIEASLRRAAPFDTVAELRETCPEDLVTAFGHEVRTPLAVISGHLELLAECLMSQGSDYRWQFDAIDRNVRRLCRSTDRLLLP